MADIVSIEKRSKMMAGIKGVNTKPELFIRSIIHKLGFRFRLHNKGLPGKPDLVFPKYKAAILVHGCFWHGHNCSLFKMPSSNTDFWKAKIGSNIERDEKDINRLNSLGWKVMIVWECSIRGKYSLKGIGEICSDWLINGNANLVLKGNE